MAIRTRFDIKLDIDGTPYDITVSETTKSQAKELDALSAGNRALHEKHQKKVDELQYKISDYKVNESILSEGTIVDKSKVWLEQKRLNKEIFDLKNEVAELKEQLNESADAVEELYKKRFDMTVSGSDLAALKAAIEQKNISYFAIFMAASQLVAEVREKK